MRKVSIVIGVLMVGVAVASGAAGYGIRAAVEVRPGQHADFLPIRWRCVNRRTYVTCSTGDARPYVDLTGSRRGGVTVKVYTLRDPQGGTLRRTYSRGQPVYIFSAF